MANRDDLLTSAEARDYLKIGRTKMWQLTRERAIPCYRLGDGKNSPLRYRRSELIRWLEKRRRRHAFTQPSRGGAPPDLA